MRFEPFQYSAESLLCSCLPTVTAFLCNNFIMSNHQVSCIVHRDIFDIFLLLFLMVELVILNLNYSLDYSASPICSQVHLGLS